MFSANSFKILLLTPSGPTALPIGSDLRIDETSSRFKISESSSEKTLCGGQYGTSTLLSFRIV